MNALVIVTRDANSIDRMLSWAERLDQEGGGSDPELFVYPIQNGRAADLATALGQIFGAEPTGQQIGGLAPGLQSRQLAQSTLRRNQRGLGGQGGLSGQGGLGQGGLGQNGLSGQGGLGQGGLGGGGLGGGGLGGQGGSGFGTGGLEGGGGGGAGGQGGSGFTAVSAPGLRIIADDSRNALIIQATRQQYRRMENAIRQLDTQPLQVLIEATIAEVTLRDQLQYGLQWFFNSGNFTALLSRGGVDVAPELPGFAAIFNTADARVILSALQAVTDVRVISSPQVLALTNQPALLQVGDSVPVPVQQAISIVDSDAPIVNSIQYVDTGVTLQVTPRVNESGMVRMEIEQNVSDAAETTTSGIDAPTIQQRRIASTVAVKSGETIGLGGLIRDNASAGRDGLPYLSGLPVVGPLFGTRTTDIRRTELLILLRPRIVQTTQDARDMTNELRSKMQGLLPVVHREP
jgi:general secretion pathway protein D